MVLKVIEGNEDTGWVRYDLHSKKTVLSFLQCMPYLIQTTNKRADKIPHVTFCIFLSYSIIEE